VLASFTYFFFLSKLIRTTNLCIYIYIYIPNFLCCEVQLCLCNGMVVLLSLSVAHLSASCIVHLFFLSFRRRWVSYFFFIAIDLFPWQYSKGKSDYNGGVSHTSVYIYKKGNLSLLDI